MDYIESATHGVIYFSFGSIVNLSKFPETKLKIFLQVISELKQKVILKWSPDKSVKLPENVRTSSWLPQMDILGKTINIVNGYLISENVIRLNTILIGIFAAHRNVKLFITHGGLHSIEEAVYNAKPIVGIPFFADQISNMKNAETNGFGKMVLYSDLTIVSFRNAIEKVLSDPKYVLIYCFYINFC